MHAGGGGALGITARSPVLWGRVGAGQLRQSCVQCLQMKSGGGGGAEASPAKLSPAAIMAAAAEGDEDESSEDDNPTVIQKNAGWAAGNRARMRALASKAWETVTLSRGPTTPAPSALGSLGSSRGPGALPAPTSSAMSLATQSYLSSLYRLDTDDGRRLSAISRYADDYWISNLLTLMRSRVFQRIFSRLAVCSAVCAVVSIFYVFFPFAPFARGQAHVITGAFLGLIVGFRANTGYQRYWAARGAWGSVHKRCRSIALLLTTSIVGRDAIILRTLYLLAGMYPPPHMACILLLI